MLEPREYQKNIAEEALKHNTLVVLPTGLGKTLIALLVIKEMFGKGKILFLAPTKPLVLQHYNTIREHFEREVGLLTGEVNKRKRMDVWKRSIIVSTPQTIRNSLDSLSLSDVCCCVFDEAHRAVGAYAYVSIAENLPPSSLILGLTASPGGKKVKIEEVMKNLKIKHVEIRTREDNDVKQYIPQLNINWVGVELLEEHKQILLPLSELIEEKVKKLTASGFRPVIHRKKQFLELRKKILNIQHPMKYRLIVEYTMLMHLLHLHELLETQGPFPFKEYLKKISAGKTKSASILMADRRMQSIKEKIDRAPEHPKLKKLIDLLKQLALRKTIIFVQYRNQIKRIVEELQAQGMHAKQFVGKREGVRRKDQERTMEEFRRGDFDILVASSVGEEGLDIPSVDNVIFYEPVPSEIRTIQRRGRAGRLKEGNVYILITKKTRDEAYFWASVSREKKMRRILEKHADEHNTKKRSTQAQQVQKKLYDFFE